MNEKPRPEVKVSILPIIGGALIALVRGNGEPKITSTKLQRHQDNIAHLTGWWHGKYYREGVVQPKKSK